MVFFFKKSFLGIDIGTFSIKVVELSFFGKKVKLENFGEIPAKAIFAGPFLNFEKRIFTLSSKEVIESLKAIFEEAEIKTKGAFFSIPDFATFFTTFSLPPMSEKEIPFAVKAEARRHIPLPIAEVAFDWQILEKDKEKMKVLLVAVPQETVNQYKIIAEALKLKLEGLEPEIFSLGRIFGEEGKVVSIFDFGTRSTTCTIIDNKVLKKSISFDIGGDFLSERIAKSLGVGFEEGERLKKEFGIKEEKIKNIILPLINTILFEGQKIFNSFERETGKEIDKIILTGGNANLPGILEYFKMELKKEVEIGNPFKKIFYPPALENTLKEIGPSFSIATGLALKGFEKWK